MADTFISDEDFQRLSRAILSLKTEAEVKAFITDICTVKEIQDIAMRLAVAAELYRNKNYMEIAGTTGASTATISRVSRCLRYGNNGYMLVLERCCGNPKEQEK